MEDPVDRTREIPERLKAFMDFLKAEVKSNMYYYHAFPRYQRLLHLNSNVYSFLYEQPSQWTSTQYRENNCKYVDLN
ncbi:hypothetical protein LAZ67_1001738 [Cordylochernes scorpioides]|uniref:Uncharacterized protein n=1 Tax=Cordylochernes scorpioides TaxID=51811 RepID=A0ABY6JWF8_9ARAC|nr:hypothetical protein LAZ67_1001738 [Cordylochernes scorpioides]